MYMYLFSKISKADYSKVFSDLFHTLLPFKKKILFLKDNPL